MYEYKAKCIRVIDGDTFVMDIDLGFGIHLRGDSSPTGIVRLLGIDTSEIYGTKKNSPEWVHGMAAKIRCEELLIGNKENEKPELVLKTIRGDDFGKYGRFLAEVYLPDGRNLKDILLEEGFQKLES